MTLYFSNKYRSFREIQKHSDNLNRDIQDYNVRKIWKLDLLQAKEMAFSHSCFPLPLNSVYIKEILW